jgi:histidinol-phosphate phosphatase family protein
MGASVGSPNDDIWLAPPSAVLLVGGLGTRLQAVVSDRPKALAPINGEPVLTYLLRQLQAAGVREAVLATGHRGDQIEAEYGADFGPMALRYSREMAPLGTGGALRLAARYARCETLLVMNGDSYCDANLVAFHARHRARRARTSILLTSVDDASRYGLVDTDSSDRVTAFREKGGAPSTSWINAGVYLLSREVVGQLPEGQAISLEREVLPQLVGSGLYADRGGGRFIDIGVPESYDRATDFFREMSTLRQQPPSVVFLDRDGTLIVERNYLRDPDQVQLLPGVGEGLRRLRAAGSKLIMVSNQSGIGRGYFSEATVHAVHERLRLLLEQEGVALDGIYFCPHVPNADCACRKPKSGLVDAAMREQGLDPAHAAVIGDKRCDLDLARTIGAPSILVATGYGPSEFARGVTPDFYVRDLAEAAAVLISPFSAAAPSHALL